MRGHLRPAIPRKYAFVVHGVEAHGALADLAIGEIPDLQAGDKGPLSDDLQILTQNFHCRLAEGILDYFPDPFVQRCVGEMRGYGIV